VACALHEGHGAGQQKGWTRCMHASVCRLHHTPPVAAPSAVHTHGNTHTSSDLQVLLLTSNQSLQLLPRADTPCGAMHGPTYIYRPHPPRPPNTRHAAAPAVCSQLQHTTAQRCCTHRDVLHTPGAQSQHATTRQCTLTHTHPPDVPNSRIAVTVARRPTAPRPHLLLVYQPPLLNPAAAIPAL
jgi:hypothetical protein